MHGSECTKARASTRTATWGSLSISLRVLVRCSFTCIMMAWSLSMVRYVQYPKETPGPACPCCQWASNFTDSDRNSSNCPNGFFLESISQDPCPALQVNGTRRITMPQVRTNTPEGPIADYLKATANWPGESLFYGGKLDTWCSESLAAEELRADSAELE